MARILHEGQICLLWRVARHCSGQDSVAFARVYLGSKLGPSTFQFHLLAFWWSGEQQHEQALSELVERVDGCVGCGRRGNISAQGKQGGSSVTAGALRSALSWLVASAAPFLMTAPAMAACGDGNGQRNLLANGGSQCDALQSSYTGQNVGYAAGDGSLLTFRQPDVTISSPNPAVHVLSVGGSNGSPSGAAATIHATGNLTVAAPSSSGTSRAIYFSAGANAAGNDRDSSSTAT